MKVATPPLPEGCLVILKSGGPLLTTEKPMANGLVGVMWFSSDGVLRRDCVHFDAIVPVAMPCPPKADKTMEDIANEILDRRRMQQESDEILNASRE